jgi:hypothetical protein
MNPFRTLRTASREISVRSDAQPLLSQEDLKAVQMSMQDLEHVLYAHEDAIREQHAEQMRRETAARMAV